MFSRAFRKHNQKLSALCSGRLGVFEQFCCQRTNRSVLTGDCFHANPKSFGSRPAARIICQARVGLRFNISDCSCKSGRPRSKGLVGTTLLVLRPVLFRVGFLRGSGAGVRVLFVSKPSNSNDGGRIFCAPGINGLFESGIAGSSRSLGFGLGGGTRRKKPSTGSSSLLLRSRSGLFAHVNDGHVSWYLCVNARTTGRNFPG